MPNTGLPNEIDLRDFPTKCQFVGFGTVWRSKVEGDLFASKPKSKTPFITKTYHNNSDDTNRKIDVEAPTPCRVVSKL